jgi:Vacuolar protein sorting-associated protein 62
MSMLDRFWPVSVATVLQERDRHNKGVALHGRAFAQPATLADLTPSDLPSAYLEYPASLADKADQMRAFLRGLGAPERVIDSWPSDLSAFAQRSAQIYFFDAGTGCSYGSRDTARYRALQYWFFYGLNYYPMTVDTATMLADPVKADTADIDFHEGDWEHVVVLLDPHGSSYVPKFVWMARHSSEGVLIPWDRVEHDSGSHPVVYPAFGGHPSYPHCGAHSRALLAAAVYDYVVCRPGLYTLSGSSTRLVDLAHVGWSCWPGYFGTTVGTSKSSNADDPTGQILVAGPRSPLRQMENRHVCVK